VTALDLVPDGAEEALRPSSPDRLDYDIDIRIAAQAALFSSTGTVFRGCRSEGECDIVICIEQPHGLAENSNRGTATPRRSTSRNA
jgi:hypothetical protein